MGARGGPARVAVVEPRCHGLEHVPFNAALIAAALAARPDAVIDVYGERTHLREVEALLTKSRGGSATRLSWHALDVPRRRSSGWERFRATGRVFGTLSRAFRHCPPDSVVVATLDPFVLAQLKARLFTGWSRLKVVAVFHELLAVLGRRRQSLRRWGFTAATALPHPSGLTYFVLSESIKTHLEAVEPRLASHAVAFEHPSLLGDLPGCSDRRLRPLRFGFVGGGRGAKGLRTFLDLARAVQQTHPEARFEIVGSVPADVPRSELASLEWSEDKLPLTDFVERLRNLTHVIWLGDPQHYRLVASGSLTDAVALGVPVICQSGPFVDRLFERLGNIGVKADTVADIQQTVLALLNRCSEEEYQEQRRSARAARAALEPEACASLLRAALAAES